MGVFWWEIFGGSFLVGVFWWEFSGGRISDSFFSHTMLSRFSFRRKVRFAPAEPLFNVEVEILWGNTLTGSSMWWTSIFSMWWTSNVDPSSMSKSRFISQPVECARRPSRELDFICNFEMFYFFENFFNKKNECSRWPSR